jgi:hypothetical protein
MREVVGKEKKKNKKGSGIKNTSIALKVLVAAS